jgi:major vault protein
LPQRALWLRVIAPIGRAELADKLPRGVSLEQDSYRPGDELLLGAVSAFFFPFNEIEVLSPATGEALVGNEHRRVFIEAIGIDQKSGIYVRDLATGEVRLVRGKQSYLVDPRREVQIARTVPASDWNLWIAAQEPHKRTAQPVTTPWALSIVVPHGTAVLAASADGDRVIEGPCVTLLGYEETLVALSLSTGTPKSDAQPLLTCFLRTVGNRVSDLIAVETADFVRISIHVSYSVAFQAAERARWFSHDNYIQVMCDHLRSIVRSRCRGLPLASLWRELPQIVRDAILGERPADGSGRKGRALDNGALVGEVEVLGATIEDRAIAELMQRVQRESVTLVIGDRQAQEQLASALLRAELEQRGAEIEAQARERQGRLDELERRLLHAAELAKAREGEEVAREKQALADRRAAEAQAAATERQALAKQAELALYAREAEVRAAAERARAAQALEEQARLRDLEVLLIQARAQATVAEHQAVQAGLIEALTALGDKVLAGEAAANMNLVSLFKGKDVATLLGEVLGGTRVAPTLRAMVEKFGNGAQEDE